MTDKVHILVVDDDLEIRELLARIPAVLRRSGHSGVPGGGQRVSFVWTKFHHHDDPM